MKQSTTGLRPSHSPHHTATMTMRRFYTPDEVAHHNSGNDCWISIFHKVYDLTPLLVANRGPLANPLIEAAGQVWCARGRGRPRRRSNRREPLAAHDTCCLFACCRVVYRPWRHSLTHNQTDRRGSIISASTASLWRVAGALCIFCASNERVPCERRRPSLARASAHTSPTPPLTRTPRRSLSRAPPAPRGRLAARRTSRTGSTRRRAT